MRDVLGFLIKGIWWGGLVETSNEAIHSKSYTQWHRKSGYSIWHGNTPVEISVPTIDDLGLGIKSIRYWLGRVAEKRSGEEFIIMT